VSARLCLSLSHSLFFSLCSHSFSQISSLCLFLSLFFVSPPLYSLSLPLFILFVCLSVSPPRSILLSLCVASLSLPPSFYSLSVSPPSPFLSLSPLSLFSFCVCLSFCLPPLVRGLPQSQRSRAPPGSLVLTCGHF
jgi:hypothetical protein